MNAHLKRLLLNDFRNLNRQQEHASHSAANIHGGPVALGANHSFIGNQKRINHGERIVANRRNIVSSTSLSRMQASKVRTKANTANSLFISARFQNESEIKGRSP